MSERKKCRTGRVCCVPGCLNSQYKTPGIRFYTFPNRDYEIERKKMWISLVRRESSTIKPWIPTKYTFICSAHFVNGEKSNDPRKENYNPSIFPWKNESKCAILRRSRLKEPDKNQDLIKKEDEDFDATKINDFDETNGDESISINDDENSSEMRENKSYLIILEDVTDSMKTDEDLSKIKETKLCEIAIQTEPLEYSENNEVTALYCWQDSSKSEASTQTNIVINKFHKEKVKIIEVIKSLQKPTKNIACGPDTYMRNGFQWFADVTSDSVMKQLGGISLSVFHTLLNFIQPNTKGQPKYYRTMNREDRLLLFLMKLKLGLSFTALSCVFKIGQQSASDVFVQVLDTLYKGTKTWIFLPSKEAVQKSSPSSFKTQFKCRALIYCLELKCEIPATEEQRKLMFSSSKNHFTVKYLIAMTPNGFISFVSKGYGGSNSNSFIVNDSKFINLIEPGDGIMTDEQFSDLEIRSEFNKKNITLILPFGSKSEQFSDNEVLVEYSNAAARKHMERCTEKINIFKVLDFIPNKFMPYMDKVMHIACVLCNNKDK